MITESERVLSEALDTSRYLDRQLHEKVEQKVHEQVHNMAVKYHVWISRVLPTVLSAIVALLGYQFFTVRGIVEHTDKTLKEKTEMFQRTLDSATVRGNALAEELNQIRAMREDSKDHMVYEDRILKKQEGFLDKQQSALDVQMQGLSSQKDGLQMMLTSLEERVKGNTHTISEIDSSRFKAAQMMREIETLKAKAIELAARSQKEKMFPVGALRIDEDNEGSISVFSHEFKFGLGKGDGVANPPTDLRYESPDHQERILLTANTPLIPGLLLPLTKPAGYEVKVVSLYYDREDSKWRIELLLFLSQSEVVHAEQSRM